MYADAQPPKDSCLLELNSSEATSCAWWWWPGGRVVGSGSAVAACLRHYGVDMAHYAGSAAVGSADTMQGEMVVCSTCVRVCTTHSTGCCGDAWLVWALQRA
jgi:hypothetical protein